MIPSVRSSAIRASRRSSGYICQACRANHQVASSADTPSAPLPPPSRPQTPASPSHKGKKTKPFDEKTINNARSVIQEAFLKVLAKAKVEPPIIATQSHGQTGFSATIELGDAKYETGVYASQKAAEAQVRLLAIGHFQKRRPGVTPTIEQAAVSQPHIPIRRTGLRGQFAGKNKAAVATEAQQPGSDNVVAGTGQEEAASTNILASTNGSTATRNAKWTMRRIRTISSPLRLRRIPVRERLRISRVATADPRRRPQTRLARLPLNRANRQGGQTAPSNSSKPVLARLSATNAETSTPTARRRSRATAKSASTDLRNQDGARTFDPVASEHTSLDIPTNDVPGLSYGLDRVLFNPGIYHVQDPRTRVYNFDPYLEKIVDPRNFDFAVLDEYKTPSADTTLSDVAAGHDIKYFSSTSNITSVMTHLHFLLSNWRPLCFDDLSSGFFADRATSNDDSKPKATGEFTPFQKSPQSVYLKPKEFGGYAVDKAEDDPSSGLLSFIGQCLEKLLTVPKEEFERYKKDSTEKRPEPVGNGYHYTKFDSILVRSQLDAHDSRLPGSGIFDIKTRAVLPIRMDSLETSQELGKNYEIKNMYGKFESYEREMYDMARSTMLKYSLQARLGRMDGIFVAYHNIARMFGFQYLSIADMDKMLHGQADPTLGDAEMRASLRILSDVFDQAVELYPDEPLRLYFNARKGKKDMLVLVHPVTEDEINNQHEAKQKQSREYLARLNRSDEASNMANMSDILSEFETSETAADPEASSELPDSTGPSDSAAVVETAENDSGAAADELTHLDAIQEEISKLLETASNIKLESEVIKGPEGAERMGRLLGPVQKLILSDLTKKTYSLGKDISRAAEALKRCGAEDNTPMISDLERLRRQHDEQMKTNTELFTQATEAKVLDEAEIGAMMDATSLEAALKASAKRETPPRLAAFSVQAQGIINRHFRPEHVRVKKGTKWEITYKITRLEDQDVVDDLYNTTANSMHNSLMKSWGGKRLRQYYESPFFRELMRISKDGMLWRKERDRLDKEREPVVFAPRS